MAIIIKCNKCLERLYDGSGKCPHCGSADKKFIIDYWPDGRNGKRVQKILEGVKDYNLALELDKETKLAIAARRMGATEEPTQYSATFNDLYQEYLDWRWVHTEKSEVTKKTHRNLEYNWQYIIKILGEMPITHFDKHTITIYQKQRQAQGVGNKTINNELYYVAGFLRWCRQEKDYNLEQITIHKLPSRRPIPIILSPDEVVRLVNVAEPFYKAFYLCLYTLGYRFAEAQYLKWGDIDLQNNILRSIQKGGSWKISVLNDWLKKALLALGPGKPDEYVFKSPKHYKKTRGRPKVIYTKPVVDVSKALAKDAKKAGILKHVNPHLLRHSIATHMLGKNINIRTIQLLLGHAQVGTTEWYTHVVVNDIKEATEEMFKNMAAEQPQND